MNDSKPRFLKVNADNFVPLTRTPWGGEAIAGIKHRYMSHLIQVPERIGESWEISTDKSFPSQVYRTQGVPTLLSALLIEEGTRILGPKIFDRYGAHSPLLLKWIEAQDVLSVQIHPQHTHPALSPSDCGKPESWLVLNVQPGGHLYLGFKEGLTQDEITHCLLSDNMAACLHRIEPVPHSYISVPAGCVHALGPGVLVAEPQYVLPGKSGKTWRISDWNRLYDANGARSVAGRPRELHTQEALSAIDWSLPRGKALESLLVKQMTHGTPFLGSSHNPFALQLFLEEGEHLCSPLLPEQFMVATIWSGKAQLSDSSGQERVELVGGESAIITGDAGAFKLLLSGHHNEPPAFAVFAIQLEAC